MRVSLFLVVVLILVASLWTFMKTDRRARGEVQARELAAQRSTLPALLKKKEELATEVARLEARFNRYSDERWIDAETRLNEIQMKAEEHVERMEREWPEGLEDVMDEIELLNHKLYLLKGSGGATRAGSRQSLRPLTHRSIPGSLNSVTVRGTEQEASDGWVEGMVEIHNQARETRTVTFEAMARACKGMKSWDGQSISANQVISLGTKRVSVRAGEKRVEPYAFSFLGAFETDEPRICHFGVGLRSAE